MFIFRPIPSTNSGNITIIMMSTGETIAALHSFDLGHDTQTFHDLNSSCDSNQLVTNREFISPLPSNLQPAIVGVAVKRNLKIGENDGYDSLDDSWQKTVTMRCAPISNFNDTISHCVQRDNNNESEVTAVGSKKCVRFQLDDDHEDDDGNDSYNNDSDEDNVDDDKESRTNIIEIDQNTFTPPNEDSDDNEIYNDILELDDDDGITSNKDSIMLHEIQSSIKCFTCTSICCCLDRDKKLLSSITNNNTNDIKNDGIEISEMVQCAEHSNTNNDDKFNIKNDETCNDKNDECKSINSITTPFTLSAYKIENSLDNFEKEKSPIQQCVLPSSSKIHTNKVEACATKKLTHSLPSYNNRRCENENFLQASIENVKNDVHVQDNKNDETITRLQSSDKDIYHVINNDNCTSGCSTLGIIQRDCTICCKNINGTTSHNQIHQQLISDGKSLKVCEINFAKDIKSINKIKDANLLVDISVCDSYDNVNENLNLLNENQKESELNVSEKIINAKIKFPSSVSQDNIVVLLENVSFEKSLNEKSDNQKLKPKSEENLNLISDCELLNEKNIKNIKLSERSLTSYYKSREFGLINSLQQSRSCENLTTYRSGTTADGNCDIFAASNRLKRLEERFKGFYYTKKLLHSNYNDDDDDDTKNSDDNINLSKILNKTSNVITEVNKNLLDEKNQNQPSTPLPQSQPSPLLQQSLSSPLTSSLISPTSTSSVLVGTTKNNTNSFIDEDNTIQSKNIFDVKKKEDECIIIENEKNRKHEEPKNPYIDRKLQQQFSSLNENYLISNLTKTKTYSNNNNNSIIDNKLWQEKLETLKLLEENLTKQHLEFDLPTPEPSTDSEEVSKLFPDDQPPPIQPPSPPLSPPPPPPSSSHPHSINYETLLSGDLYTNCEFDVRHLGNYNSDYGHIYECYDELEQDDTYDSVIYVEENENVDDGNLDNDDDDDSCTCSLEALPIYKPHPIIMRETTAGQQLRGLLKKPNRPPPVRKNRVVFDETRNEFFEADYIILIREDCPYDEEDEEPCTCGEHELVRLCCEEGCQCPGYTTAEECRTPQVGEFIFILIYYV